MRVLGCKDVFAPKAEFKEPGSDRSAAMTHRVPVRGCASAFRPAPRRWLAAARWCFPGALFHPHSARWPQGTPLAADPRPAAIPNAPLAPNLLEAGSLSFVKARKPVAGASSACARSPFGMMSQAAAEATIGEEQQLFAELRLPDGRVERLPLLKVRRKRIRGTRCRAPRRARPPGAHRELKAPRAHAHAPLLFPNCTPQDANGNEFVDIRQLQPKCAGRPPCKTQPRCFAQHAHACNMRRRWATILQICRRRAAPTRPAGPASAPLTRDSPAQVRPRAHSHFYTARC